MDQMRLQLQLLQQLHQPPPAVGGLERDRHARRRHAKDRHQLDLVIGEVAVALHATGGVQDRDLGALAMHLHADLHIHQASVPELDWCPKPNYLPRNSRG